MAHSWNDRRRDAEFTERYAQSEEESMLEKAIQGLKRLAQNECRARFDHQQQSNKEEGDDYVIETKEKRKCRAPSNLHPSGDGRGFSGELSA
jgi:hypothetical protein